MRNKVNHPDHYQNIAGVEAIDILNDVVKDLPGKQAAMLWNSMKYLLRFQKKNGVEDLKKARNYLDYLIADMDATCDAAEKLWDTWYSKEYGRIWIFAGTNPKGMPMKLIFETKDAAEEFKSVFYNMISERYDEFSIADACLEMKFKFTKGNKLNNWDELVPWEKVHDRFAIKEADGKYELIFVYKSSSSEEAKNIKTNDGAREFLDSLIKAADRDKLITVAYLYAVIGKEPTLNDYSYGWERKDLNYVLTHSHNRMYGLEMPKPRPIKDIIKETTGEDWYAYF